MHPIHILLVQSRPLLFNLGEYEQAIDAFEYAFLYQTPVWTGIPDCAETCVLLRQWDPHYYLLLHQTYLNTFWWGVWYRWFYSRMCYPCKRLFKLVRKYFCRASNWYVCEEAHYMMGQCFAAEVQMVQSDSSLQKSHSIDETSEAISAILAKACSDWGVRYNFKKSNFLCSGTNSYWFEYFPLMSQDKILQAFWGAVIWGEISSVGSDRLYCRLLFITSLERKSKSIDIPAEVLNWLRRMYDSTWFCQAKGSIQIYFSLSTIIREIFE